VPKQGQSVKLHRLGAPAAIDVGYRARKVSFTVEALVFLLVAFWGVAGLRRPLSWKAGWVIVLGLLAVVCTGVVSPVNARVAKVVVLALGFVVLVWFVLAMIGWFRAIGRRLATAPAPKPAPQPKVTPTSGPARHQGSAGSPQPKSTEPTVPKVEEAPSIGAESFLMDVPPASPAPLEPDVGLNFPKLDTPEDKPQGGAPPQQ
jgi:hypothetical protein